MNAVVALVGRPNVGKSTLFNRLVGHREAITLREPGITRDRLYGTVHWLSKSFTLIDTGGFIPEPEQPLEEQMRHQVQLAIKEAELVLLAVDGKEGLHPADKALAETLRKEEKLVRWTWQSRSRSCGRTGWSMCWWGRGSWRLEIGDWRLRDWKGMWCLRQTMWLCTGSAGDRRQAV